MANSKLQRPLGSCASIRTGFTFRGKIEEVPAGNGNARVVQIKDARKTQEETGTARLDIAQLPEIAWEGKDKAFINENAVLLPARGGYFKASCLVRDADSKLPVVASSQFLVLIPSDEVIPEFLCWALNQPTTQRYLEEIASQGSSISMLSTAAAKLIKLEIPHLPIQKKILHLVHNWEQEKKLTQALLNNREKMLQGMFQQLLKGENS